ncbi:MAG: S24/S26 family peptidase [Lachnospiraceae bacterium]
MSELDSIKTTAAGKHLITLAEHLKSGKPVVTMTTGVSMEPLLYANKTHVVIEPVKQELKENDIVLWQSAKNQYILHRIIRVEKDFYITRGDNCITTERVPKQAALGVVVQIYRNGKTIHMTDKGYLFYVYLWRCLDPVRITGKKGFYRVRGDIGKVLRWIK